MTRQLKRAIQRKNTKQAKKAQKLIDLSLGVRAKRFKRTGGRYYGPTDPEIFHNTVNPLKPSWTTVASVKSSMGLEDWWKKMGMWADVFGPTSAIIGTITHDCVDHLNRGGQVIAYPDGRQYPEGKEPIIIEDMLLGYPDIRWRLVYPFPSIAIELVCKQIMSYMAFFNEHKPNILASEIMMWHPDVPWSGTADLLVSWHSKKQNQEVFMLGDLKTGSEQDSHFVQCQAYALLAEKIYGIKISVLGVLYCTGKWRTKPTFKMKAKEVRNKAMKRNDASKELIAKAMSLYETWKVHQRTEQPSQPPMITREFKLEI